MMLDDCDYSCRECGLTACLDADPSPCEEHRVCAGCSPCEPCRDQEIEEARLRGRDYDAWAAL